MQLTEEPRGKATRPRIARPAFQCGRRSSAVRAVDAVSYREPLPEGCPPDDAEEVTRPRSVFRLVRGCPPTEDDFRSQRAEKPDRQFSGVDECRARGLSVHADPSDSARARKLPTQKGKKICRVQLDRGAGRIRQTGRPSHHTWWPLAAFDIIANCSPPP